MSPLMFAASHGNDELVRALIESGANVDASNQDGKTAEEMASDNEHTELANLLEKSSLESFKDRIIPRTEEASESFRALGIVIGGDDLGSGRARVLGGSSEKPAEETMGKDLAGNKENKGPKGLNPF